MIEFLDDATAAAVEILSRCIAVDRAGAQIISETFADDAFDVANEIALFVIDE
jgi:hypothetical protein